MESKILLRINRELHIHLKYLAIKHSLTLNQTCIDLIEVGLKHTTTEVIKPETSVTKMVELFKDQGMVAILKGYVADYVLIFSQEVELPENVQHYFEEIVQALRIPIQIAQKRKCRWSLTPVIEQELLEKLNRWSAYLSLNTCHAPRSRSSG